MEKNNEQELQLKFQMFEQKIMQINQQIQALEQAIAELDLIKEGLDNLSGKKDKEILAAIGKGIFVKAKLSSENLTVNVGERNFVEKSISETKELLDEQKEKLNEARQDLEIDLRNIDAELTKTMMTAVKKEKENSDDKDLKNCEHNDNKCEEDCSCDDDCVE